MELIPILSTIILVATISTFILAIGAYILYKIRESRGEHYVSAGPSEVRAELVTPAVAQAPVREVERAPAQVPAQVVVQQPVASSGPQFQPQPIFVQQQFRPEVRPSKVGVPSQQYNAGYTAALARDSKFMKYTTEGYVSAKEDINAGALKWK